MTYNTTILLSSRYDRLSLLPWQGSDVSKDDLREMLLSIARPHEALQNYHDEKKLREKKLRESFGVASSDVR